MAQNRIRTHFQS